MIDIRSAGFIGLVALPLVGCGPSADAGNASTEVSFTPGDVHVLPVPDVVARIVDVEPATEGRVWVLNSVDPFFIVLGPEGEALRTFGTRGEGPAEFSDPAGLFRGPTGETWTFDVLRNALRPVSDEQAEDMVLPSASLPPWQLISFGNAGLGMLMTAPWIQSHRGAFLLARQRPSAPQSGALGYWHADILTLEVDSAGVALTPSIAVADLLDEPAGRYPNARILLPYPLWTVCSDGTYGLYDPLANALRRFGSDHAEASPVPLREEREVPMSFNRLFGMVYRSFMEQRTGGQAPDSLQMRSVLEDQFRQSEREFADVFPEYADLRCAEDGSFWLRTFSVDGGAFGRGGEWTRITDGVSSTINLPEGFTLHRIDGDRIWGATVDALGVPSVAWIDLEFDPGG